MEVHGLYGDNEWKFEFGTSSGLDELFMKGKPEMARPVFIPAIDMMGHTLQFNQAYNQVVAEGIRKIAALVRLQRNGWLGLGTTLFWDEPETNINPILMDELIGAILGLARQGVQVFLTTHSYVILKELDLQATAEDKVRFFSLKADNAGTQVIAADNFTMLEPNSILQQYGSLYDRDIRRASGRPRR